MNFESMFAAMKPPAPTGTPLEQALAARPNEAGGLPALLKAFETLSKRNSQKLKDTMAAYKAVKTPQDFMELQKKLMTDGMADAAKDSAELSELTKAAFTAAMEPMRKKMTEFQTSMQR